MIILHEFDIHTDIGKCSFAPAFGKEAAVIAKPLGCYLQNTGQSGLIDNHFDLKTNFAEQVSKDATCSGRRRNSLVNKPNEQVRMTG